MNKIIRNLKKSKYEILKYFLKDEIQLSHISLKSQKEQVNLNYWHLGLHDESLGKNNSYYHYEQNIGDYIATILVGKSMMSISVIKKIMCI